MIRLKDSLEFKLCPPQQISMEAMDSLVALLVASNLESLVLEI